MADALETDPHGHLADAPGEIPRRAWKDILARTYKRTWDDNVALVSAGVAFYAFFALLSLLGLTVLVYGLVVDPRTVIQHIRTLASLLPRDVVELIGTQLIIAVRASEDTKNFGIAIAALVALYGGINGAAATLTAMNIAYEEKEKRGLLRFYGTALFMTVAALTVALVAIAGTAAVAMLDEFLPAFATPVLIAGQIGGYVILALLAAALAATLYRYGPSRERARWRWITPGSTFASLTWLAVTGLFGFYVTNFSNYSATYGSLGAAVALLMWLYLSAYVFVIGAELNSEIEHQTAKDSTTGSPEPLGDRGAWAADNVAIDSKVQDRPEEQREGEKLTQAAPKVADEKG